jgi:hypothetical protein
MLSSDWWKPFALLGLLILAAVFLIGLAVGHYL